MTNTAYPNREIIENEAATELDGLMNPPVETTLCKSEPEWVQLQLFNLKPAPTKQNHYDSSWATSRGTK